MGAELTHRGALSLCDGDLMSTQIRCEVWSDYPGADHNMLAVCAAMIPGRADYQSVWV